MMKLNTLFSTLLPLQSWLAAPSTALHHPVMSLQSPITVFWGSLGAFLCSPKAKGLGVLCLQCGAFWGSSSQGISEQPEQRILCFVLWVCLCCGDEEGDPGP